MVKSMLFLQSLCRNYLEWAMIVALLQNVDLGATGPSFMLDVAAEPVPSHYNMIFSRLWLA